MVGDLSEIKDVSDHLHEVIGLSLDGCKEEQPFPREHFLRNAIHKKVKRRDDATQGVAEVVHYS